MFVLSGQQPIFFDYRKEGHAIISVISASWFEVVDFLDVGTKLFLRRNVLMYFDAEMKKNALEKIHRVLKRDGYLLLGTGETATNLHDSGNTTALPGASSAGSASSVAGAFGIISSGAAGRSSTATPWQYAQ